VSRAAESDTRLVLEVDLGIDRCLPVLDIVGRVREDEVLATRYILRD
jgi:hypothetical protein